MKDLRAAIFVCEDMLLKSYIMNDNDVGVKSERGTDIITVEREEEDSMRNATGIENHI